MQACPVLSQLYQQQQAAAAAARHRAAAALEAVEAVLVC